MAWLSGWQYRKAITITGSSAGSVTNYQIEIRVEYGSGIDSGNVIYLGGKVNTDFSDVRFTDADGQTLLDYAKVICNDGSYAVFWVKVPSIVQNGTATIYIYYGNSSATDASNPSATFLLWKDFEDGTMQSLNVLHGVWSVDNVTLNDLDDESLYVLKQNEPSVAGLVFAYFTTPTFSESNFAIRVHVRNNRANYGNVVGWYYNDVGYIAFLTPGAYTGLHVVSSYLNKSLTRLTRIATTATANTWNVLEYAQYGNKRIVRTYVGGSTLEETSINDSTYSYSTSLSVILGSSSGGNSYWFDNVMVRKYIEPEPYVSAIGSEETGGQNYTQSFSEALATLDSRVGDVDKIFSEGSNILGSLSRVLSAVRGYAELVQVGDVKSKDVSRDAIEVVTISGLFSRNWTLGRGLVEAVLHVDSEYGSISREAVDGVYMIGSPARVGSAVVGQSAVGTTDVGMSYVLSYGRVLQAAVALYDSMSFAVQFVKSFSGQLVLFGNHSFLVSRRVSDVSGIVDRLAVSIGRSVSEAVSMAGRYAFDVVRDVDELVNLIGSEFVYATRQLSGVVQLGALLVRSASYYRMSSGLLTSSDAWYIDIGKNVARYVVLSESVVKSGSREFTGQMLLLGSRMLKLIKEYYGQLVLSDVYGRGLSMVRDFVDIAGLFGLVVKYVGMEEGDVVTPTGVYGRLWSIGRGISNSVSLLDSEIVSFVRLVASTVMLGFDRSSDVIRSVGESALLGSYYTGKFDAVRSYVDVANLGDVYERSVGLVREGVMLLYHELLFDVGKFVSNVVNLAPSRTSDIVTGFIDSMGSVDSWMLMTGKLATEVVNLADVIKTSMVFYKYFDVAVMLVDLMDYAIATEILNTVKLVGSLSRGLLLYRDYFDVVSVAGFEGVLVGRGISEVIVVVGGVIRDVSRSVGELLLVSGFALFGIERVVYELVTCIDVIVKDVYVVSSDLLVVVASTVRDVEAVKFNVIGLSGVYSGLLDIVRSDVVSLLHYRYVDVAKSVRNVVSVQGNVYKELMVGIEVLLALAGVLSILVMKVVVSGMVVVHELSRDVWRPFMLSAPLLGVVFRYVERGIVDSLLLFDDVLRSMFVQLLSGYVLGDSVYKHVGMLVEMAVLPVARHFSDISRYVLGTVVVADVVGSMVGKLVVSGFILVDVSRYMKIEYVAIYLFDRAVQLDLYARGLDAIYLYVRERVIGLYNRALELYFEG